MKSDLTFTGDKCCRCGNNKYPEDVEIALDDWLEEKGVKNK